MRIKYILMVMALAQGLTACVGTTGVVRGKLCYPSEYVPAMNVYLKSSTSGKIYKIVSKENQPTFTFKKVPEGNYVAFAYTLVATAQDINNKKSKTSGGFTRFVPCGMSVDCKDHTLISFKVAKGKTLDTINICDWYGASVPPEK